MENSPQIAEEEEDDKDIVKPKSWLYEMTQKKDEEDKPSWFSRFVEDKPEKPDKSEANARPKLELIKNDVEPPEPVESEQSLKPVLELVPNEPVEEIIDQPEELDEAPEWPKLVEEAKEEVAEDAPDPATDPVVESFFDKVENGEEPKAAFEEVMTELGVEEAKIEEMESETAIEVEPETPIEAEPANQISYESVPDEEPEELEDGAVLQPHTGANPQATVKKESAENIPEKPSIPVNEVPKAKEVPLAEKMKNEIVEKAKKIREAAIDVVVKDGPKALESFKYDKTDAIEKSTQHESVEPQAKLERIGQMIVDAESKPTTKSSENNSEKAVENISITQLEGDPLADRKLETLNRTELLSISEKIIIDGSSLRQIFETHLIGERGLRRIIREHLRGGDLKKALQMEIVEREIDFERDPVVRDVKADSTISSNDGGAAPSGNNLNNLVQKASAQINANEEEAFIRARAAYEADQVDQIQKTRRVIDISFVVVISSLIVIVIYLLLRGQ